VPDDLSVLRRSMLPLVAGSRWIRHFRDQVLMDTDAHTKTTRMSQLGTPPPMCRSTSFGRVINIALP
jgi:hypothetical protein